MRGRLVFFTLVLILPVIQSGLSSPPFPQVIGDVPIVNGPGDYAWSSGGETMNRTVESVVDLNVVGASSRRNAVRVESVCPSFNGEYVSLRNCGLSMAPIQGYSISDGEGKVALRANITLQPGETVYLCSNSSALVAALPSISSLMIDIDQLDVSGQFILADRGDELLLTDASEVLIDVVIFGDSEYSGPGWEGEAVPKPPRAHEILRKSQDAGDTNSSSDWMIVQPGRSAFNHALSTALVEPFLAPDDARSVLIREFGYASRSIYAAVYELDDEEVVSALISAARRGVAVRVLLEGQPVGGISEDGKSAASELVLGGVQVLLLKSRDGYKRYDYLHCKYAVVDGRRSIVMSENWVTNGIDRNRGWGVVMESRELASYLASVFSQDCCNRSLDIWPFGKTMNVVGTEGRTETGSIASDIGNVRRYNATVGPLVSPDFSLDRLSDLIGRARSSILVEQFYCDPSWLDSESIVAELFSAASRGVSVRVLFDSSWFNAGDGRNNSEVVERLNQRAAAAGLDLEARLISEYHPFSIVHNKGLVIDDVTIVSSMNWADSSFKGNREIGVEVWSKEVSSFFSDAFWEDWETDPFPPILNLSFRSLTVREGTPVWLDASESRDNAGMSRILWDDGADGSIEWEGPRHLVKLDVGNHLITVIATDVFNNSATSTVEICVLPAENNGNAGFLLLLPSCGAGGFLIWRILKKIKTG